MGTITSDFRKLFDPKGIAVVGASDSEGKVGSLVFKQLMGSKRELYPVNPKRDSIYGYKVYKDISDLPEKIDLAITTVSAEMTLGAVEAIIRKTFSLSMDFHILIVDDNSPDGTADKVKELQQEYTDRLHILERKGKLGLGTAYIA